MKGLILGFGLAVLACLPVSGIAQNSRILLNKQPGRLATQTTSTDTSATASPVYNYLFQALDFPTDVFTQLFGINDRGEIAGYHGSGLTGHPNVGFTVNLEAPTVFTIEDFPGAVQTQVVGIDKVGDTDGFYIDAKGDNHGFAKINGAFSGPLDFPSTTSVPPVNQLLGLNSQQQLVGFYNDNNGDSHGYILDLSSMYEVFTVPGTNGPGATNTTVTGVNESGELSGFYTDNSGAVHGFFLNQGKFQKLNFPQATATQAFGVNNNGQVVGSYTDSAGLIHGFIWSVASGYQGPIDDPSGVGSTLINGINDGGVIVGFYGQCVSAPNGATTCSAFVGLP
jgi:probable HAF family extracellular repeat protein